MDFKTAAQREHERQCYVLGIPADWSLVRFTKMPYEQYTQVLPEWIASGFKIMFVEFDTTYQEVTGEFYAPPEFKLA